MKQRLAIALLPALLLLAPAWAHQQKEAVTRVLFNQRTGNIEVMHRFLLHDVEHAVKALRGTTADILGSKSDREFFAAYVHRGFSLADENGVALSLRPIGHEVERRFLWVYSETAIPDGIDSLAIRHQALRDIWPGQVTLVNVEHNGMVRSATFTGSATEQIISLDSQ
jgi:hypothetical protein